MNIIFSTLQSHDEELASFPGFICALHKNLVHQSEYGRTGKACAMGTRLISRTGAILYLGRLHTIAERTLTTETEIITCFDSC